MKDRLIELLKRDALRTGEFTLASGRTSHYYVDGRKITLSSEGSNLIAGLVLDHIRKQHKGVTAVGGLTLGADPIVGATIALGCEWFVDLRGFLVRKEPKGHGTGQLIEGPLRPGDVVAIVDDVATTGESALKAADAALAFGCEVACVVCVLDRLEGAAEAFAARGIPLHALCTIRDLGVEPLAREVT